MGVVVAAMVAGVVVVAVGVPAIADTAEPNCDENPNNPQCPEPAPEPEPEEPEPSPDPQPSPTPAPTPSPTPTPVPTPSPSPTPAPSPTENCLAPEEGAVSFGDVDRDCDGTLLLSEQGDPISIRRSVELAPPELTDDEAAELEVGETEDRFEPTDFVPGTLVDFDTESEQGGTIREGSLIYTPPDGFTGQDRYTFFVRGGDGLVREAEVLVDVRFADVDEAVTATEEPSPSPAPTVAGDAADRALALTPVAETSQRWDPPWLAYMVGLASLLLGTAIAWWLLLEVRIQDRLRSR